MTVTGTPGTGTITLNAASSGYQTFAAAYAADDAANAADAAAYAAYDAADARKKIMIT